MAKGMIGISGDLSQWVIIIVLVIVGICIFSMFMGQREKFAGQSCDSNSDCGSGEKCRSKVCQAVAPAPLNV